MSKRLASFGGPSAPSSSPISGQSPNSKPAKTSGKNKPKLKDATPSSPGPTSPRRENKVTSHSIGSVRAARTASIALKEPKARSESDTQSLVRSTLKRAASELDEWESIISRRALKCAKLLVDMTTELENALGMVPPGAQPRSRILGPRLKELDKARVELKGYLVDLSVIFSSLTTRVSKLESALAEFIETNGLDTAERTALWDDKTWALAKFVSHGAGVLRPLNRSRHTIDLLARQITAYSLSTGLDGTLNVGDSYSSGSTLVSEEEGWAPVSIPDPVVDEAGKIPTFDEARNALASWSSEASLIGEFIREWTELCAIEIVGWEAEVESDEDEDD